MRTPEAVINIEDGFDTAQFVDSILRQRSRYTNRPGADRILPAVEVQKPKYEPIELASDLVINQGLKEAKWDSFLEMRRFINDINMLASSGKSLAEAVNISVEELEVNIRSYDAEITRQRPFLVHHNRFGEWNGEKRVVGNNGRPVVDAIAAQERKGAVVEASQSIEYFLLSAPENSFAVLMSPAGWNGFINDQGEELFHLNAEIMIFWKNQKGDLKGGTIVVDLLEEHASRIMLSLGVSEDSLAGENVKECLANIVRHPALISLPEFDVNPFEFVLNRTLSVRGNADFRLYQRDGTVEIRSVEVVRENIKRFDQLFQIGEEEARLIDQPGQFVLSAVDRLRERQVQQEIIHQIENTILRLARKYLRDSNRLVIYQPEVFSLPYREDDFSREIMFLQTRAGCPSAGGSSGLRSLSGVSLSSSAGGAVYFVSGGEAGKKGKRCISCGEENYCTKTCYKCDGMLV